MPRKPTLDNPKKEIACALARAGMTGRWIAAFFGIDESTLRYALDHDESFRLRYDQARAMMFLDHLTHIANAASKSWRASAWLLERTFPECNLRHRMPDDSFNREPPSSVAEDEGPRDEVEEHEAHDKPEAQAKDDSGGFPTPNPQPPTPNPQPPAPSPQSDLDLTSFETAALVQAVPSLRRQTVRIPSLPPDHPLQTFGEILPPRNRNALRERIYAENPQGFELDRIIEEETRKELEAQRAAMRE